MGLSCGWYHQFFRNRYVEILNCSHVCIIIELRQNKAFTVYNYMLGVMVLLAHSQVSQLLRYPKVKSLTLSHLIPEITISTIITCYYVDCDGGCLYYPLNFWNAMVEQNMLHSILSTIICLFRFTNTPLFQDFCVCFFLFVLGSHQLPIETRLFYPFFQFFVLIIF